MFNWFWVLGPQPPQKLPAGLQPRTITI